MNPSCQHPHLTQAIALLAAGVSDPESRPALEAHLTQCPACQARYNQLLQVALEHAEEARSTPLPTPSRPFRQTLHTRILATNQANANGSATTPARSPAVQQQPSWIPWWFATAAVGLCLLLLAVFWPSSTPPRNPRSALTAQTQPSVHRLAVRSSESLIVYRLALNESLERFDAVLNDAAQLLPPTQPTIAMSSGHQVPLWE